MRVHLHALARLTVLALCALLGGASLGAALGHWSESDSGAARIVRTHSPKYGPVASVAIPPPVVVAAVAPRPKPAPAPAPAVAPAKIPLAGPIMPASLRPPAPPKYEDSPGGAALAGWRRHAVTIDVSRGTPVIAIIIDDLGVDQNRSMRAVALKGPLTLAYLPYARDLPAQTAAAHAAGHELLVHLPMEPQGHENPGPGALMIGMLAGEITVRVSESLDRVPLAVGINNHMGSRFTRDSSAMRPVMTELKRRGLLFLDSRTAPDSVGTVVARVHRVPYAERDVFLDNDSSAPAVQARLAETEMVARRTGAAVAIGHPHDGTLEALELWLDTIEQRGFALVPITTIVARREARMSAQAGVETMTRRP